MVILHCLRGIHEGFKKIGATELIRCTCPVCRESDTPHEHRHATLMKYKNKGMNDIQCDEAVGFVSISAILEGVFGPPMKTMADIVPMLDELIILAKNEEDAQGLVK